MVMNAANEVLVQAFLDKKIGFTEIGEKIEQVMEEHDSVSDPSLEEIIAIDKETRERTRELI